MLNKIKIHHIVMICVSIPLSAFVYCVASSCIKYSFQSTRSHCNVWNFAPSISAAIGNVSPNREIWRFSISLITIPRLVMAWMYWTYLRDITYKLDYIKTMINTGTGLHLCELASLLLLSFVDSDSNRSHSQIHKIAFGIFLTSSILYFFVHYYLFSFCRRIKSEYRDTKSVFLKKMLLLSYGLCILVKKSGRNFFDMSKLIQNINFLLLYYF